MYEAGSVDLPFVIDGRYEVMARDTVWEEHSHPSHELLWNERGASSATVGARTWTISTTAGLWVPAGTAHHGWAPAGTWQRAVQLNVEQVPSISPEPVGVDVTPLLRLLLDRLGAADLSATSRARTEAMVLDLLVPATHQLLLRVPTSPLVAPLVAAVRADPADPTTLAQWSVRLGVSTRTLTRVFRTETGLGFARWVATARAQHAVPLLARGESVDEVAERVGYRSSSAFGSAFRRVTGQTPGQFRR